MFLFWTITFKFLNCDSFSIITFQIISLCLYNHGFVRNKTNLFTIMELKFSFLRNNYPELFAISELTEKLYYIDASSLLAKSRLFSEKMAILIWQFENLGSFDGNQVERINQSFYSNSIYKL